LIDAQSSVAQRPGTLSFNVRGETGSYDNARTHAENKKTTAQMHELLRKLESVALHPLLLFTRDTRNSEMPGIAWSDVGAIHQVPGRHRNKRGRCYLHSHDPVRSRSEH